MRLCVFGAPGAGKSTLARVLERATCSQLEHIRGDDYIHADSADFESLRSRLTRSSSFILDHVSAPAVLRAAGIPPAFAVYLTSQYRQLTNADSSATQNSERQRAICREHGWQVQTASTVQQGISLCLDQCRSVNVFPKPVGSVIVKVASRCNLSCRYCYMYHAFDGEWPSAPTSMPTAVAQQVGRRLAEYVKLSGSKLSAVIHGGEPLAIGLRQFTSIIRAIDQEIQHLPITLSVQTNGTLVTPAYLALIDEMGLHVGISVDGGSLDANKLRVDHSGAPAYASIMRGIDACLSYPFTKGGFGGVLCVVDPAADGRRTYRELRALGLNSFDFLLRDEQHSFAPGGKTTTRSASAFLLDAFDAWLEDRSACNVRLFQAILAQIVKGNFSTDTIGLQPTDVLAVGTSGDWQLLDSLRICFPDAWKTSFSIFDTAIADVIASDDYQRVLGWQYDLADTCLACRHLAECGGGYLPHRYHPETTFRSPSTHCDALFDLMSHVKERLNRTGLPVH